jgi:hypothetical protein
MLTRCRVPDLSDHRGQLESAIPIRAAFCGCGAVLWCDDRCRRAGRATNRAVAVTAGGTDAPALEDTRGDVPNVRPNGRYPLIVIDEVGYRLKDRDLGRVPPDDAA